MAARSLFAFTGIVSAMLVASMAVAGADFLRPVADAGSQPVQSTLVKFSPDGDANVGALHGRETQTAASGHDRDADAHQGRSAVRNNEPLLQPADTRLLWLAGQVLLRQGSQRLQPAALVDLPGDQYRVSFGPSGCGALEPAAIGCWTEVSSVLAGRAYSIDFEGHRHVVAPAIGAHFRARFFRADHVDFRMCSATSGARRSACPLRLRARWGGT